MADSEHTREPQSSRPAFSPSTLPLDCTNQPLKNQNSRTENEFGNGNKNGKGTEEILQHAPYSDRDVQGIESGDGHEHGNENENGAAATISSVSRRSPSPSSRSHLLNSGQRSSSNSSGISGVSTSNKSISNYDDQNSVHVDDRQHMKESIALGQPQPRELHRSPLESNEGSIPQIYKSSSPHDMDTIKDTRNQQSIETGRLQQQQQQNEIRNGGNNKGVHRHHSNGTVAGENETEDKHHLSGTADDENDATRMDVDEEQSSHVSIDLKSTDEGDSSKDQELESREQAETDSLNGDKAKGRKTAVNGGHIPSREASEELSLHAISQHIETKDYSRNELDEDEVIAFTHATHRHAENRTKYRENLAALGSYKQNEYNRIYQEEEYFTLADGFFRDIVDEAAAKAGFGIQNRVLAWLKRASGLQKPDDPLENAAGLDSESDEDVQRTGRRTRRAKKERRQRRFEQEYEGVSILADAVREIEKERGNEFMPSKESFSDSEASTDPFVSDDQLGGDSNSNESPEEKSEIIHKTSNPSYPPQSELIAQTFTSTLRVRVICGGLVLSAAKKDNLTEWHVSRKRLRAEEQEKALKKARTLSPWQFICIGDRILIWWNADQCFYPATVVEREGKKCRIHYDDDQSEWLDMSREHFEVLPTHNKDNRPTLQKKLDSTRGRIEYGMPDIYDGIAVFRRSTERKAIEAFVPSSHTAMCLGLYRFMSSRARKWAKHEYFYSDIDAAFYKFDPNTAVIGAMVPPGTKISWKEWKTVRRQLQRPRRFSRSFLIDELHKRNEYRRMVRALQQSPGSAKGQGFAVPPIIQPGASVTAYNKRYDILQRGKVLFFSAAKNGYLIQFDDEKFGCEFCLDTEIARMQSPQPLLPKSQTLHKPSRRASLEDVKLLPENDISYERYSLVSLLTIIGNLVERKRAILDALEESNRSSFPYKRSQMKMNPSKADTTLPEDLLFTMNSWLHANLLLTNNSIRKATSILKACYSENLLITKSRSILPATKPDLVDKAHRRNLAGLIVKSIGNVSSSRQLDECVEALIEMEMRKLLRSNE